MIVRGGRKHAAFVVGRHILTIAYHLLADPNATTTKSVDQKQSERRRTERLKRGYSTSSENPGFQATLTQPLHDAWSRRVNRHFQGRVQRSYRWRQRSAVSN
jgi:hypothetical protein